MKKNKLISAVLSLGVAAAMMPAPLASSAADGFEWIDAYSGIVEEYNSSGTEYSYAPILLDDDNVPELIVYDSSAAADGGVYTYDGEKAVLLSSIGTNFYFMGCDEDTGNYALFYSQSDDSTDYRCYLIFRVENGDNIIEHKLVYDSRYVVGADGVGTATYSYTDNGKEITREEYNDIRSDSVYTLDDVQWLDYSSISSFLGDIRNLDLNEPENLDYTFYPDGTLTITGSGEMPSFNWGERSTSTDETETIWYDGQMPPWYNFRSLITNIVISEGITTISKYSFTDCDNLEYVKIPSTITKIGQGAFYHCDKLSALRIPEGTAIGYENFAFSGLSIFEVPAGSPNIYNETYYRMPNLRYIIVSNPQCDIYQDGACVSNYWDHTAVDCSVFNGTIIGYAGSTAQSYAESYNYNFKSIESIPFGDVNFDGKITASDSATVLGGYADNASRGVSSLVPLQEKLGDANGDGVITVTDAAKILEYYAYNSTGGTLGFEEFLSL